MAQFNLPAEVKAGALAVAARQGVLPDSPGQWLGDDFHLCAAACVAYAGLQGRSHVEAGLFRDGLKTGGGKAAVVDAFLSLGFAESSCEEMMKTNDMSAPDRRIRVLRDMLHA